MAPARITKPRAESIPSMETGGDVAKSAFQLPLSHTSGGCVRADGWGRAARSGSSPSLHTCPRGWPPHKGHNGRRESLAGCWGGVQIGVQAAAAS